MNLGALSTVLEEWLFIVFKYLLTDWLMHHLMDRGQVSDAANELRDSDQNKQSHSEPTFKLTSLVTTKLSMRMPNLPAS